MFKLSMLLKNDILFEDGFHWFLYSFPRRRHIENIFGQLPLEKSTFILWLVSYCGSLLPSQLVRACFRLPQDNVFQLLGLFTPRDPSWTPHPGLGWMTIIYV